MSASSLIVTAGALQTRNDDNITLTGPTLFNLAEGTILAEFQDLAGLNVVTNTLFSARISAGNQMMIQRRSGGQVSLQIDNGSVTQALLISTYRTAQNGRYRVAASWRQDNFALTASGGLEPQMRSGRAGTLPTRTPVVAIGSLNSGVYLTGRLRRLAHSLKCASPLALKHWVHAA